MFIYSYFQEISANSSTYSFKTCSIVKFAISAVSWFGANQNRFRTTCPTWSRMCRLSPTQMIFPRPMGVRLSPSTAALRKKLVSIYLLFNLWNVLYPFLFKRVSERLLEFLFNFEFFYSFFLNYNLFNVIIKCTFSLVSFLFLLWDMSSSFCPIYWFDRSEWWGILAQWVGG
jgi:hypothetical protein